MDLLAALRYHGDALAALRAYGNDGGARASLARAALDRALAEVPGEVARLRTEATELHEAGATVRALELHALADDLEAFDPFAQPESSPSARKRGRRHG